MKKLTQRAWIVFFIICLTICVLATTFVVRSHWRDDILEIAGLSIISEDRSLLVGHSEKDPYYFSGGRYHEGGPATLNPSGLDGLVWLLFVGDLETGHAYRLDGFALYWRTDIFPYWFVVIPTWVLPIPPGIFCVAGVWTYLRRGPGRTWRESHSPYLWLLLYLPAIGLLIYTRTRPDPDGFGNLGSAAHDNFIGYSAWSIAAISMIYMWRFARHWAEAFTHRPSGFDVLPAVRLR